MSLTGRPQQLIHSSWRVRWLTVLAVTLLLGLQAVVTAPQALADPGGECADPPVPEVVSSGMTGAIDPTTGQGLAGSIYLKYGYAGQVWHVYDAADNMLCSNPHAEVTTWVGNALFNAAKVMVASVNSLHYMINEGGLPTKLDKLVKTGAQATFDAFASPFVALALLLVGIFTFWYVFRGKLADAAKTGARVGLGLTLVAATAFSPLLYTHLFDNLLIKGYKKAQSEITQAVYPGQDDDVIFRHVLPTTLHREIVYENWLRGEFGSADTKLAKKLGPDLVWAQACSWSEVRSDTCDVEAKQKKFEQIAKKIKSEGNYAIFTGKAGSRPGAGALALFESIIFGLLQLVAKMGILLAQLVLRVFVLFGPIIGILALAPGVGRRVLRGVLGVGVLGLLFNVVAGVHTFLIIKIMDTDISLMAKLMVITLVTMLIWSVLRPVKRLKSMVASSMSTMPGENLHRAGQWLQHASLRRAMRRRSHGQEKRWWNQRPEASSTNARVSDPPDDEQGSGPVQAAATVLRPEGGTGVAAAALPAAGRSSRGGDAAQPGRGGAPPPPPRGPSGDAPAGHGAAATPPPPGAAGPSGPIRAEATRLWEPNGTAYLGQSEPDSSSGHALPGSGGRGALPPAQETETESARPEEGRSDLVTPTEILSADQAAASDLRPAPSEQNAEGKNSYVVYNPRTNQMEFDAPQHAPQAPRPETPGNDATVNPDHPVNPQERGDSDADPH